MGDVSLDICPGAWERRPTIRNMLLIMGLMPRVRIVLVVRWPEFCAPKLLRKLPLEVTQCGATSWGPIEVRLLHWTSGYGCFCANGDYKRSADAREKYPGYRSRKSSMDNQKVQRSAPDLSLR